MKVLFFGRLGEQIGREIEVDLPAGGCSVAELRRLVVSGHAAAADALSRPGIRAAVDQAIVADEGWVRPGQEVAFLSPLSGG